MIVIRAEQCTGCGACVDACPYGAMYLVDGKAALDATLCRECAACVSACPAYAIVVVERAATPSDQAVRVPVRVAGSQALRPRVRRDLTSWQAKALPILGLALSWAVREVVPRLADYVVNRLEQAERSGPRAAIGPKDSRTLPVPAGGRQMRVRARRGWWFYRGTTIVIESSKAEQRKERR